MAPPASAPGHRNALEAFPVSWQRLFMNACASVVETVAARSIPHPRAGALGGWSSSTWSSRTPDGSPPCPMRGSDEARDDVAAGLFGDAHRHQERGQQP